MIRCLLFSIALLTLAGFAFAEAPKHRVLSAIPFTEVKFNDEFWTPRLEINREKSLPHNFEWCEKTGRISNFAKAGKLMEGKFEGILYNDSDVYKMPPRRCSYLILAGSSGTTSPSLSAGCLRGEGNSLLWTSACKRTARRRGNR